MKNYLISVIRGTEEFPEEYIYKTPCNDGMQLHAVELDENLQPSHRTIAVVNVEDYEDDES